MSNRAPKWCYACDCHKPRRHVCKPSGDNKQAEIIIWPGRWVTWPEVLRMHPYKGYQYHEPR